MAFDRISVESDYRFPEGAFDVRGREVRTGADDEKVGRVDDVLIDDSGEPRYLDIDMGFLKKHVLLPVGHARSDRDRGIVQIPGMRKDDFSRIPEAVEGELDREYETRLTGAYDESLTGERLYARPEYGSRRAASGTPAPEPLERVDQLSEVEVADDDPDPRGWTVVTTDGKEVGRVDHLIGDTRQMRVRYLTVDLEPATGKERRVLIPTGFVDLEPDERTVRLNALESSMLRRLPEYQGKPDREYAHRLQTEIDTFDLGPRRYEHPRYSTTGLFGVGHRWR